MELINIFFSFVSFMQSQQESRYFISTSCYVSLYYVHNSHAFNQIYYSAECLSNIYDLERT